MSFDFDAATTLVPARYRKKPVVIEAHRTAERVEIVTLEGTMVAEVGDWIITGVKGERYPCKPDIFAATYEPVECDCGLSPNDEYGGHLATCQVVES